MSEHRFQVNLGGMIRLFSDHLYDDPGVFLRELLQNAVDGISARRQIQQQHIGSIDIKLTSEDSSLAISVVDDGIGLTEDDVHIFLSTIGASSKIHGGTDQSFLGRFGVGLLSGFLVADEITLVTKSIDRSQPALEWTGRADGVYSLRKMDTDLQPGTCVTLRAKQSSRDCFRRNKVEELARRYGQFLTCKITLHYEAAATSINREPPWRHVTAAVDEWRPDLLARGRDLFGEDFLDAFAIVTESPDVEGIGFILPYALTANTPNTNRIFLKGMFLTESDAGLLPEWAFFMKFVLNVKDLAPTAARDSLVLNDRLLATRREISRQLKAYLVKMASTDGGRFREIVRLHYLPMKALAVEDESLYEVLINGLPFESSHGRVTLPAHFESNRTLRYIDGYDEYREAVPIALAQNVCVFNAGLAYDRELLQRYSDLNHGCTIEPFSIRNLIDGFQGLNGNQQDRISFVLQVANDTLEPYRCHVECRTFSPVDLPAIYHANDSAEFLRSVERVKQDVDELWNGVMSDLCTKAGQAGFARLVLNYDNVMVKQLREIDDNRLIRPIIQILYLHALLLGHHQLSDTERSILGNALCNLVRHAMSGPT